MTRQALLDYAAEVYGDAPDFPWAGDDAVLRHPEDRRWYGLLMSVGRDKLGLPGPGSVDVLTVKCDPIVIGSLREREGAHPAYHMNKDRWVTLRLDGSVPDETIKEALAMSYELTLPKAKARKKTRQEDAAG